MKILLVLEATLGGTSRHILDLADGLLDRGVEVHLIYSTLRADRGFVSGLASLRASRPEFRCCEIKITRELGASDISSYGKLWRYVRLYGPFDVIHSHSTKAGFLARLLLGRGDARMVYTPHGLMTLDPSLKGLRRKAVSALESALARRTDSVIAVSENENRCAARTGIDSSKLTVIPNGIRPIQSEHQPAPRDAIRRSMDLPLDTVCIGFVGRLFSYKEPGRAIEAFSRLLRQAKRPSVLALIGSGSLESELRHQVAALGLMEHVLFLGEVDGASHMPAFDILCHTSRFEGFSYVFLEALSAGIPIVTTRVGAADELVTNGVTGYICDPWDTQTFANYMQLLVDDPQPRLSMSAAARERAAPYTAARMVDSVAQLYDRLCATTNGVLIPAAQWEDSR